MVVVLVLLVGGLQGEVQVGPGDARDKEVHHGPQLQEGIVQGRIDEEQALLAEQKRRDDSGWAQNCSLTILKERDSDRGTRTRMRMCVNELN